ncbi:AAA family ATPase [Spiroplasma sp. SV19]|uniref:AAA family ATPase n=1 Tax=Spiroplasma sp. SV19 TaxID=2570468 RepID=UPI0024B67C9F|nr:AAA family ATPase [Spiroplasma sp. SV19]
MRFFSRFDTPYYIHSLRPEFKKVYLSDDFKNKDDILAQALKLIKDNKKITEYVNDFFKKTEMLQEIVVKPEKIWGYDIVVPRYIDYNDRTKEQQFKLSIAGMGISQILPILTSVYNNKMQRFIIEQPEIHLHPKAQAEFGNVLYNYYTKMKKKTIRGGILARQLFIESHSLYILNRLRTCFYPNEKNSNEVSLENITVFYFYKNKNLLLLK